MNTFESNGKTYELVQVDSTTIRRVPIGQQAIGPEPSPSKSEETKSSPTDVTNSGDDLTEIKGVGAKKAAALNEAGIFTFEQLAASDDKFAEAAKDHT